MKYARLFLTAVLAVVFLASVSYAGTAGVFRLPYDPTQRWQDCTRIGYKPQADQIFMEWNDARSKYHLAEDWNGVCGHSSDLGAVLYAVADGVVEDLSDISDPDSFGKLLLIRHPLPDGTNRYILYEHLLNIETNPRTGTQFKKDDFVYIGDSIARLGDGNGFYTTQKYCGVDYPCAHLHFEMRRDNSLILRADPYYNPLTVRTALRYSSPSLFIDDRENQQAVALQNNNWISFSVPSSAPSSTAFVEYSGLRRSLLRAANLGWIHKEVFVWQNNRWEPFPDITQVWFEAGKTYAVKGFVSGATLNV